MAFTQNNAFRSLIANAGADALDGATLTIRTSTPAGPNAAANGTALATVTLPTPAFGDAASGVVAKAGTWEDNSADATGTAGHFRIEAGSYVCEGTVTVTGGGGDLTVDDVNFVAGEPFTITGFTMTFGRSS